MTGPDEDVNALYDAPLPADRTGPLYNAFSYPTKISAESVGLFIACHTQPGDRVLDVFGGSGTTAIGALLCERPTERMLGIAAERGLSPKWGARDATVYELSEIGTLLARVMTHAPDPREFEAAACRLLADAEQTEPELYQAQSPSGDSGTIRQVIWSDVVRCPRCGLETTYAATRVRYEPLRFEDFHTCECGYHGASDSWSRVIDEHPDPWTGKSSPRRKRVPWKVYGASKSGNWSRQATEHDGIVAAAVGDTLPEGAPIAEIRWGDLHRSGYHQGMTHLHHLYTPRNFRALATVWSLIAQQPAHLHEALRLWVLSYNASHSTLMTRVVVKKNVRDFVVTGAQSGVMYVSGLPVEKNVFVGLRRKVKTFTDAFTLLHGLSGDAEIVTGSSTDLHLADESIDYVFTDPPFGAYIPYSEINQLNELWLGATTDTAEEAIISPAQNKDLGEYQGLLTSVFTEVARVMKAKADVTLVFHSAHASVWQALTAGLAEAGLTVTAASILDKTQGSFKQVSGHNAVSGDPLLRLSKAAPIALTPSRNVSMLDMAASPERSAASTDTGSVRSRHHEYSALVGKALVGGVPVTLDASALYRLRGRE